MGEMSLIALVSTLVFLLLTTFTIADEIISCEGGFDLFFVLDHSGSVGYDFPTAVNFSASVIQGFKTSDDRLRVSIVYFDHVATTILPLTGDQSLVDAAIVSLENEIGDGNTCMARGLENTIAQFGSANSMKLVFVLSDGEDTTCAKSESTQQADIAKGLGAFIYTIGIGNGIDQNQLNNVASQPYQNFTFHVDAFDDLLDFVAAVIESSCIEIDRITPNAVCKGDTAILEVSGRGFSNGNDDLDTYLCSFETLSTYSGNEPVDMSTTATYHSDKRLTCPSPLINETTTLELEISVNGLTFTQSNVTLQVNECEAVVVVEWGFWDYMALFIPLLFLLFFLLWCLWPIITNTPTTSAPPAMALLDEEEPESNYVPPPAPTLYAAAAVPPPVTVKKWKTVETGHYVWSRDGGTARPLSVKWGDKGAMPSAPGTKIDTEEVDVPHAASMEMDNYNNDNYDEGSYVHASTSCWDGFVQGCRELYYDLAKMRPQPKD